MALIYIKAPSETPLFSDEKHQFLSRAWQEWFGVIGDRLAAGSLIDRGDPTAVDYTLTSFTADGTWRDLNLSSIVPAGAKAIWLAVRIKDAVVGTLAKFRKNGLTNAINITQMATQVASQDLYDDPVVVCDSARVIEYNIAAAMDEIDLTVKGWFI